MNNNKPVYVTQPFLPPLEEFAPYLERIWNSKILANNGPFHKELEAALCEHLGVEHISLFANGTLALVTALQVLWLPAFEPGLSILDVLMWNPPEVVANAARTLASIHST